MPTLDLAITKNDATAANTAVSRSARTLTHVVRTPLRFAEISSNPVERSRRPEPLACSQTSSAAAPMITRMNAIGTGPMLLLSHVVNPRSIAPPGLGRRLSEMPFRMLNVARVAMIDGIFTPRMRTAFTPPSISPAPRMATTPRMMSIVLEPFVIQNEAMMTPNVIIAPTDRSR